MDSSTLEKHAKAMLQTFRPDKAGGLKVTYQIELTGPGGGVLTLAIADRKCQVSRGGAPRADTVITMSTDHYLQLAAGRLNVTDAYQKRQIKIGGNLNYALKLVELFSPWASLAQKEEAADTAPAPAPSPPSAPPPSQPEPAPAAGPTLADYAAAIPHGFRPDRAGNLQATYQFELIGSGGGTWSVTVANHTCTVSSGSSPAPSVIIQMTGADFIKLARGRLDPVQAFSRGQIKINGDLNLAGKLADLFGAWAGTVEAGSAPEPAPQPAPEPEAAPQPAPQPKPAPAPAPAAGPVNPTLLNGSFDDYQPYVRDGQAKGWREFPERYGAHWELEVISEAHRRIHVMDSAVFGQFTQKYFGGGGRDYHIHGHHSQVVTSRYGFDLLFKQTVAANPGQAYTFRGSIVSFYKGTSGERADNKIFKTLGIDPTGGRDWNSPTVIWGERDGRDNQWCYPSLQATAQGQAITVFIRLENVEEDVGKTELNTIHLDDFRLE